MSGCTKVGQQSAPPPSASGEGKIGYVDMYVLVRAHPMYAQLAQTERSIDALNLRSIGPDAGQTGANLSKEDAELQKELTEASDRTNKILNQKQVDYQREENAAIAAALAAGGRAASGPSIGAKVGGTANQQSAGVNAEMQRDNQAYQKTLAAQQRSQTTAYERSVNQRANQQYSAKVNELQTKESEFALSLATKDAPQRLELRTKLSNLAMDASARESVQKELDALDRTESDQVAAMRNRDQQTLAQLRSQLKIQAQHDVDTGAAKIASQNASKVGMQPGPGAAGFPGGVVTPANLPPDLKSKIEALHKQYQERFTRDAKATIDQFNKTRDDLKKRYDELHRVDSGASSSLRKELASLQAQHDQLYAEIVDQINREVRLVAVSKGVTTVLSDVSGNGNSVDLTEAAKKEIESLHE